MPSSTRLLLFSSLFALSSALPWSGAEPTASYKPADYVPRPTSTPQSFPELLKRQAAAASTCGWIGGLSNSPVVCPSGSSCIWDVAHSVVGCCPEGVDCSTSIYTGCVDGSSPSSASDANIRTCGGGNVCYRNSYPGGYYQYGCGASSNVATVQTTFSGQSPSSALNIVFTSIAFAQAKEAAVSSSTTSAAATSSASSTSTTAISSSSTSASSMATAEAAATVTPSPTATPEKKKTNRSAIIAGSTIAALGAIFAISAVTCLCLRRRAQRNHEDFIMRRSVEEKVKYFGTKTSITASSRGSSDYTSQSGRSTDLEQGRALTPASSHESSSIIIPDTPTPQPLNIVTDQPRSHLEVQAAQSAIVSPLTPPQYTAPPQDLNTVFEAHPGQLWANVPLSPPAAAAFTLISHPSTASQPHNRVSSAPELRRVTLTDAPYDSPTEGLSRASTVSYGPPPTPPVRSPMRLTRNSTIAQQMSLLPRAIFQTSPTFQPQPTEPHVQVSQVDVPPPKKMSPKRDYPSYSYAQYSQLKEEGGDSPSLEYNKDVSKTNIRRYDTISSVYVDNVLNGNERADDVVSDEMLQNIHPALRRHYGSNASTDTAISVFSDSSRYSRDTSGNPPPSRSKSRRMDIRRSIAQRSLTRRSNAGRSVTGKSISGRSIASSSSESGKNVPSKPILRKALPSKAAVKAYGDIQRGGHLAAFLKTQEPHPPILPPATVTTYPMDSPSEDLDDVPLTSIGDINGAALRFLGGSIRKPERAAGERVQDLHVDMPLNIGETESLRPRGEQWRPESKDSNYVAPLRLSRHFDDRPHSGERRRGAGVPLLAMPVPGDGRGRMVYEV